MVRIVTIYLWEKEKCVLGVPIQPAFGRVCTAFGRGGGAESAEYAGAESDDWVGGADGYCNGTNDEFSSAGLWEAFVDECFACGGGLGGVIVLSSGLDVCI